MRVNVNQEVIEFGTIDQELAGAFIGTSQRLKLRRGRFKRSPDVLNQLKEVRRRACRKLSWCGLGKYLIIHYFHRSFVVLLINFHAT
jgi:hypothetical protein